jgi:hypothetical protein
MNARFSAPTSALVSPDCVRGTIQKILRSAQIRFTDEQLEAATGVSARCIKSYRVEGREPSLGNALAILLVLGKTDLNRVLDIIGYSAVPLDEAGKLPCAGTVVASGMASLSTLATAAADGRFDHTEMPACRQAADALIECVLPLSSAGAAA